MRMKQRLLKNFRREISFMKESFLHLVFPPFCPLCETELKYNEQLICVDCFLRISTIESHFCTQCAAPLKKNRKTCDFCKGIDFNFSKVRAFAVFATPLVEMIHLLKYERKTHLAIRLGILLGNLFLSDAELFTADVIIPVPLHRTRMRERGYNQSLLLARMVSSISHKELCSDVVLRTKATKSQTTLNHGEREKNLKNAFCVTVAERIKDKSVVIIDDVFTTGTTLNEMAGTLIDGGAHSVYGLVLARALST